MILPLAIAFRDESKPANGAWMSLALLGSLSLLELLPRRDDKALGWTADAVDTTLELGSANVATPAGYHRTALKRSKPSAPLRHLQSAHPDLIRGKVLDYGSGRGQDCATLQAHCYDPHHPQREVRRQPSGKYDTVLMTYVLNVLPQRQRAQALRQARDRVASGGVMILTVRGTQDTGYQAAKRWTPHGDGYAKHTPAGKLKRFQRFYASADQLHQWAAPIVGRAFERVALQPLTSDSVMIAYQRKR